MKKLLKRDKKVRAAFKNLEMKKRLMKSISVNQSFFKLLRWKVFAYFNLLPAKSSFISFTNRCVLTNRRKRINKYYNISRIVFIRLSNLNRLSGLKKLSW